MYPDANTGIKPARARLFFSLFIPREQPGDDEGDSRDHPGYSDDSQRSICRVQPTPIRNITHSPPGQRSDDKGQRKADTICHTTAEFTRVVGHQRVSHRLAGKQHNTEDARDYHQVPARRQTHSGHGNRGQYRDDPIGTQGSGAIHQTTSYPLSEHPEQGNHGAEDSTGNQPRETKAKRMPKAPTAMKAPRQEIAPATPATARGAIAMPRLPPRPCRPSTRPLPGRTRVRRVRAAG